MKARRHCKRQRGQALVEFVLVMPILLFIAVAAAYMALGMYQGHLASDAVRNPALPENKYLMAGMPQAISPGQLAGWANGAGTTGNAIIGSPVDSVQVVGMNPNDAAAVIVGQKVYTPPGLLPAMTFSVSQPINTSLLMANQGANARPVGTEWFPYGSTIQAPP